MDRLHWNGFLPEVLIRPLKSWKSPRVFSIAILLRRRGKRGSVPKKNLLRCQSREGGWALPKSTGNSLAIKIRKDGSSLDPFSVPRIV